MITKLNEIKYYLAIDIGAGSGRHIVGWSQNGEIHSKEVYRFPNYIDNVGGSLVWDTERLFTEVKNGIKKALSRYKITSLAIDTWGVDYVLIKDGKAINPCYAYRDDRTENVIAKVHSLIPLEELYKRTGIQFMPFNTIYQLFDDKVKGRLADADTFMMIPDYLNYRLTGKFKKEATNASTTGLINLLTSGFDKEIINKLGFPEKLFTTLSQPGESVGMLSPEVSTEVGGQAEVILAASHDTASAYESIDSSADTVIISSGTWSLVGTKLLKADSSALSLKANFSNEGGPGYFRYLKNAMGMWMLSSLKKELNVGYDAMNELAASSPYNEIFDVNDPMFVAPDSMKGAISEYFRSKNIAEPQTNNELFACVFRSLAASYARIIQNMEINLSRKFKDICIIGGGAKNYYLNTLTEEMSGKKVIAMPIEATAIGNLKIQIKRGENDNCIY